MSPAARQITHIEESEHHGEMPSWVLPWFIVFAVAVAFVGIVWGSHKVNFLSRAGKFLRNLRHKLRWRRAQAEHQQQQQQRRQQQQQQEQGRQSTQREDITDDTLSGIMATSLQDLSIHASGPTQDPVRV